jgi:hypothetical protein
MAEKRRGYLTLWLVELASWARTRFLLAFEHALVGQGLAPHHFDQLKG